MTWQLFGRARRDSGRAEARWRGTCALIAGMAAAVILGGCGQSGQGASTSAGTDRPPPAPAACAVQRPGQSPVQGQQTGAVPGTTWPERRAGSPALRTLGYSPLAVDPATATAYALIPRAGLRDRGPYRLWCTALATGVARKGPELRARDLAFASGYLWASGQPGRRPVVDQIDPRSLSVVRSIRLPGLAGPGYPGLHVTAGPGHSVWVGSTSTGLDRTGGSVTMFRLDASSGRILGTARLPAGTVAYDLAFDPSGSVLYAAAAHIVGGGPVGNLVLEYDARSGRLLATAGSGLVTESVAGSALTSVPGGVWVSFRTGMLGLTLHLRQAGLALAPPSGQRIVRSAPVGLYHWAMYASTAYGGGSLWLANQAGFVACIDPGTGRPRATERLSQDKLVYRLLGADQQRHRLYAADGRGLLVITPPAACWAH